MSLHLNQVHYPSSCTHKVEVTVIPDTIPYPNLPGQLILLPSAGWQASTGQSAMTYAAGE